MFKTEVSGPKGNVGIFIFDHKGTTWGLELCHLRELPEKKLYREGDIIAYSGNTGAATTGAHLHAVLHRDAAVSKHYQLLLTREVFLKLEAEGAILDCYAWFCEAVEEPVPEKNLKPPVEKPDQEPPEVVPITAPSKQKKVGPTTAPTIFVQKFFDLLVTFFIKRKNLKSTQK